MNVKKNLMIKPKAIKKSVERPCKPSGQEDPTMPQAFYKICIYGQFLIFYCLWNDYEWLLDNKHEHFWVSDLISM